MEVIVSTFEGYSTSIILTLICLFVKVLLYYSVPGLQSYGLWHG